MNIEEKEELIRKAGYLISKVGFLNIVYMRVSTNEQNENDQEKDIFNNFDLVKKNCLIIRAKESAFKKNKQKFRKLNIIYEILEFYKEPRKKIYFWDLDRIYRRRTLLVDFFAFCKSHNAQVLSFRQKFLYELRNLPNELGDVISNIMIQLLGWIAEEESLKRAARLKKAIRYDPVNDVWITNKNNKIHGLKIKRKLPSGRLQKIQQAEILKKIEDGIVRSIKKKVTYRKIKEQLANKNIQVSLGYISGVRKKRGLLPKFTRSEKKIIEKAKKIRTRQQEIDHKKYINRKNKKLRIKKELHEKEQLRRIRSDEQKIAAENKGYGLLPQY